MMTTKKKRIMLIGEKETFLIRVLMRKMADAKMDAVFVPIDINAINSNWDDCELITYYLETGDSLRENIKQFLIDKMTDHSKQMVVIGDKLDVEKAVKSIPKDLLYRSFERPLDSEEYIREVKEFMDRVAAGAFKKSILVVDDDPTYLGVVRDWLKDIYQVSMVSSGMQAIKWLGKNKADLILLDYEMPVTGGPQVLEMLRADEETRSIPVIFLTGKSDKESVMSVVALKPEGYFLKSIEKETLLNNLKEFFITRK